MASSNRHWPSMFKSKHCNNHHQWHLKHNPSSLLSTGYHRPPFTSGGPLCEERSPEPKPRWNPKPEQISILEAIFNSGMINPPRDEIRKIRAQLEKYGQIGDANVFYWFQNKKSRSKNKLRHPKKPSTPPPSTTSSSSSSENPSTKVFMEMVNSPSASVNNNPTNFKNPPPAEPYLFPTREILFPPDQMSGGVHEPVIDGNMLLGEFLMMNDSGDNKKVDHDHETVDYDLEKINNRTVDATEVSSGACATGTTASVPSTISHFQGVGEYLNVRPAKSTVFINDVAFQVNVGPFNVRETFGDETVLIQSNGHPVFTNEWGVTAESLQHCGCYYLMRTFAPVDVSETLRI